MGCKPHHHHTTLSVAKSIKIDAILTQYKTFRVNLLLYLALKGFSP